MITAPLLQPGEPEPYTILNPEGRSRAVLVCEHGGIAVPRQLRALGLGPEHYTRHYAHDVGARRVTETLSLLLDAPAIIANYSRLVVDINRSPGHPTTFPVSGEGTPVPGNVAMTAADRALRLAEIYEPFHNALTALIDRRITGGTLPALIAIHSYTPVFFGEPRPWEAGILWVQDDRLPRPVLEILRAGGVNMGDNEPYDARAMGGGTMNVHGDDRRLPNMLFEIRHDLINSDEKCDSWAKKLGDCLQTVLAGAGLDSYYEGPQHQFDPDEAHRYFEALAERARENTRSKK